MSLSLLKGKEKKLEKKKKEKMKLFIKHKDNIPVGIRIESLPDEPDVSDLIAVVRSSHLLQLGLVDVGPITLHLPEGLARSALNEDCFATVDENDTTLDPGCPLSSLGTLGSLSKKPLIIKAKTCK